MSRYYKITKKQDKILKFLIVVVLVQSLLISLLFYNQNKKVKRIVGGHVDLVYEKGKHQARLHKNGRPLDIEKITVVVVRSKLVELPNGDLRNEITVLVPKDIIPILEYTFAYLVIDRPKQYVLD